MRGGVPEELWLSDIGAMGSEWGACDFCRRLYDAVVELSRSGDEWQPPTFDQIAVHLLTTESTFRRDRMKHRQHHPNHIASYRPAVILRMYVQQSEGMTATD
jgi:hypothetical protein